MGQLLVDNGVANADGIPADGAAKNVLAQSSAWGGGSVALSISRDGGVTKIPIKKGDTAISFTENDEVMIDAAKIGTRIYAVVTGTPADLYVEMF